MGKVLLKEKEDWNKKLYHKIDKAETKEIEVKLVPYYAWGNREKADMTVWLPLSY